MARGGVWGLVVCLLGNDHQITHVKNIMWRGKCQILSRTNQIREGWRSQSFADNNTALISFTDHYLLSVDLISWTHYL